jgi:FkbM family methyltransferase
MKTSPQQLESLLRETPAAARIRRQNAFDEAVAGRRQIVIFGAGNLGRSLLRGLSGTDLEPVAFADNNPRTWGTTADGLPVLSPQDAANRHSQDAAFVVAVWHPSRERLMSGLLHQLRNLGCHAVPFPLLFWRHSSTFLPYFLWDLPEHLLRQRHDVAAAFELLYDDFSRQSFVEQLQLRLRADFDCIGAPFPGDQYFPGLFSLTADECFVDCGSYTGDTIQSFISQPSISQPGSAFRKVIAFEADPENFNRLTKWIATLEAPVASRISALNAAVGAKRAKLRFRANGGDGARLAADGNVVVECIPIDDLLFEATPTFIKMDIEGAELDALEGARRSIQTHRPILSICAYHQQDHLWRIPLFIHSLVEDYRLFLRPHCGDGWEFVCYAVPANRLQLKIAA